VRFVAQEEEPVAGLEVVSLAAGREGDPPVEAIDRWSREGLARLPEFVISGLMLGE
jgi:hypothetical protein